MRNLDMLKPLARKILSAFRGLVSRGPSPLEHKIVRLRQQLKARNAAVNRLTQQVRAKTKRLRHGGLCQLWLENRSILRPVVYSGIAAEISEELASDCYISLLPITCLRRSSSSALMVAWSFATMSKTWRSIAVPWTYCSPAHIRMYNHLAYGGLMDCDKLLTVGNQLARTPSRFQRPTMVREYVIAQR